MAGVTILTRAVKNVGRHKREEKTTHTHDTPFPGQKESSLRGGTLESSSGFSFFPRSLPGHFYDRHSRRRRSWPPSFSRSSNVEDVGISRTNRESGHGARSKQEPAGYYLSNSHALCTYIYILGSLDTSMEENRQSTISNPLSHRDRFGHAKVRKRCTCACSFFSAYLKASLTRAPGASIATSARVINSPVRVFLLNYRRAIDIAC